MPSSCGTTRLRYVMTSHGDARPRDQESYELRKRLEAAALARKEEKKRLDRELVEENRKKTMELRQIEHNRLQRLAGPNKPKVTAWAKWTSKVLGNLLDFKPYLC